MPLSRKIADEMTRSSWIRRMFEEGERMRADGTEPVYDFSLGNPMLDPPDLFVRTLKELALNPPPGLHRYMANVGYESTRRAVAAYVSGEYGIPLTADRVIMTVGAAGGCNVTLKALLDPGDDVIVPAPFFVEYEFYIDNHGGVMVQVPTTKTFDLDVEAIGRAVTARTKAIILNTPNNPTGVVYSGATLARLADLLRKKGRERGAPIYAISDEPYRKIIYDGARCPSILEFYDDSVVVSSHSKDLGLAGERIGWIAVHPKAADGAAMLSAMAFSNRTLGYVNAPAIMQRAIEPCLRESVDVSWYRRKRDRLCAAFAGMGYEVVKPGGAFYLFPVAPGGDDVAFCRAMVGHRVLVVPGSGFGTPGYFRLSYCVPDEVCEGALPAFAAVMTEFKRQGGFPKAS